MIDPELLEILACPDTHQPLTMADDALVASLNAAIEASGLKNVGGDPVEGPLDGGLVREDGAVVYPIRDRIPVLLVDEGISLPLSE
jgi:uncharacterized protein YbaR (Trm112 family)